MNPLPPQNTWCSKCLYPASSAVTLTFDAEGVCSGCRVAEQKRNIDWQARLSLLLDDVEVYRNNRGYDCIIGVSGGKDSYYQVHFVKEVLKLNPLLVTYNGNNYLDDGWRNLMRMREVFGVDHIIISPGVDFLKRMNRLCFRMMGDMNWHNHAGIATVPVQIAVRYGVPLIFWGEHGWTDLGGMHSMSDMVEYTARYRKDQLLRGYDWDDMVGDLEDPISENELEHFKYPSDSDILKLGARGIFIGNFDPCDANEHTKLVKEKYGWQESSIEFERTYRRFSNLDDRYENGVHDYLKYIKFGYGRATDHACKDIRSGYISRDQGIEYVRKYDHVKSSDLYIWLDYVEKDEPWFWHFADSMRSPKVWSRDKEDKWVKHNIWDK